MQRYALERWLRRLSLSEYSERFILKGALMLSVWDLPFVRPTKDIDFLAKTDNDLTAVRKALADICNTMCEPDGLQFDADSVKTVSIAEDAMYEGVRGNFTGVLGNARIKMQVDIGFSDLITPNPVRLDYPTILDQQAPQLLAYNLVTAIAEKCEAMIKLGGVNSRMKDFFDVWVLAKHNEIDGAAITAAFDNTFARRGTSLSTSASCFTAEFANATDKQTQWRAFLRRSGLIDLAPADFAAVLAELRAFLVPIISGDARHALWSPGGPWRTA